MTLLKQSDQQGAHVTWLNLGELRAQRCDQQIYNQLTPRSSPYRVMVMVNPLPAPGIVVGAVHGRRGTRAAARGAPGAAW